MSGLIHYLQLICGERCTDLSIVSAIPHAPSEAQKKGIQKHQAVFSLDFETFDELVEVFGLKNSVIPHRDENQEQNRQTWYG